MTQNDLELLHTDASKSALRSLELDRVITLIALEARTPLGKAALERRVPHTTLDHCEREQKRLSEMVHWYAEDGPLPFAGLTEIAPLLESGDILDLQESWVVLRAVRATQLLREMLLRGRERFPLLAGIASGIDDLSDTVAAVGRYFTSDGKLREEASAELRSIRTRIQSRRGSIQKTLSDLMARNADAIQESIITIRSERYCIPVRTDHRNAVRGILHERSGSGQSLFIEPLQIVEMNNDLSELLQQEREEIARITRIVSERLTSAAAESIHSSRVAGELDAIQACAVIALAVGATRPTFTTEPRLRLVDARHPLLDERLATQRHEAFEERQDASLRVVPVSLDIGHDRPALLISGPNAGGKTVTLKTAGLLVAMALCGLPVPASDGTVIPIVDAIYALIGDDQDVLEHLSTFSGHLMRLKGILERTTVRSLVLLDELGSGTDPEEGSAIAAAVVEHLLELGCLLVSTTHLAALKTSALADPRIVSAGMEFDTDTGRPTFTMIVGVPGRSRAIEVAEMLGFPQSIVDSARARVGEKFGETDALLVRMRRELSEAETMRIELAQKLREAKLHETRARDEAAGITRERATLAKTLRREIEQVRRDVDDRLRAELGKLRETDRKSRESIKIETFAKRITEPLEQTSIAQQARRDVRVGDTAEHRQFGMTGSVISIDGTKTRLEVGGKHIQVELGDLLLIHEAVQAPPAVKRDRAVSEESDLTVEAGGELNLIGLRVEEALEESDRFIDRALLEGRRAIRLIHGFGTGALKKAIRDSLRKHRGVKSHRPGEKNEGGDGATVAILDV